MRTIIFQDFLRGVKIEGKVCDRKVLVVQREPRHKVVCDVALRAGEDAENVIHQYVRKVSRYVKVVSDHQN